MARGVTLNPALARWAAASLREVLLPTGTRVKVRIPDPEQLIRNDALPEDLLAIAKQFIGSGISIEATDVDGLVAFATFSATLAASCVKQIQGEDGGWEPVTLTLQDLDEIDAEDREALRDIVLRHRTPNQVTAESILTTDNLSEIERTAAVAVKDEEAGATVDGWAEFPGQRPGADAGAHSADVRGESGGDIPRTPGPRARRGDR